MGRTLVTKKNVNKNEEITTFTREQLERFDGRNNRPLYIVFKGKVYDVTRSRLWVSGRHMGVHIRDENLTETIKKAPHEEVVLERFPVVGQFTLEAAPKVAGPVAPSPPKPLEKKAPEQPSLERRDFLKLVAAAGGAITLGALASSLKPLTFIPQQAVTLSWPRLFVVNIDSLNPLEPITFNYPLTNTPNMLIKLGQKAENGVGPDQDIVAFSSVCQHLGCFYGFLAPNASPPCNSSYVATIPMGYCCCHGSQYDLLEGAKVISGPAPRPVPQVKLEFDSATGKIYAVSMGPPTIFGHGPPGTTDPALVLQYDLQGGQVVSSTS